MRNQPALLHLLALFGLFAFSGAAAAADEGLGLIHGFRSWLVGCDNTRNCEAQGYADAADEQTGARRAAIVVQRAAGPAGPVKVHLRFANSEDGDRAPEPGQPVSVVAGTLKLTVPAIDARTEILTVPPSQVPALLGAVRQADKLLIGSGALRWWVSLDGASAALLKMDELQRRVGTPGALVRRGSGPESQVPRPQPPIVNAARLPPTTEADRRLEPLVRAALPRGDDDCPSFDPDQPLRNLVRLDDRTLLVSQDCYRSAYQVGSRLWRVADRPPFQATSLKPPRPAPNQDDEGTLVVEGIYADGTLELREAAKSRGAGDCWSVHVWTWTMQGLVLTEAHQSDCRAFEAGGISITLWRTQLR